VDSKFARRVLLYVFFSVRDRILSVLARRRRRRGLLLSRNGLNPGTSHGAVSGWEVRDLPGIRAGRFAWRVRFASVESGERRQAKSSNPPPLKGVGSLPYGRKRLPAAVLMPGNHRENGEVWREPGESECPRGRIDLGKELRTGGTLLGWFRSWVADGALLGLIPASSGQCGF